MNSIEAEKENLRKEIRNLINQIEEKKVIYKKKLDSAQKSDEELEETYSEINKLIEDVNKLNEELQKLNGKT